MATYSGPIMVERPFTLAQYPNLTSRLLSLTTTISFLPLRSFQLKFRLIFFKKILQIQVLLHFFTFYAATRELSCVSDISLRPQTYTGLQQYSVIRYKIYFRLNKVIYKAFRLYVEQLWRRTYPFTSICFSSKPLTASILTVIIKHTRVYPMSLQSIEYKAHTIPNLHKQTRQPFKLNETKTIDRYLESASVHVEKIV